MSFIAHRLGLKWLLDICFPKTTSPPTTLYVALFNDTPVLADGLTDLQNEMSGNGYARVALTCNNTNFVVTEDTDAPAGYRVAFSATFTADGGAIGPFTRWALCTSSDNSGTLLATGDVASAGGSRTINDTESLQVNCRMKVENIA